MLWAIVKLASAAVLFAGLWHAFMRGDRKALVGWLKAAGVFLLLAVVL